MLAAPPRPRGGTSRTWLADLLLWAGLCLLGLAVVRIALEPSGVDATPFLGHYGFHATDMTLLAPTVAVPVLAALSGGWHRQLPWSWLLLLATLAAIAWTLALALAEGVGDLADPLEPQLESVPTVGDDPGGFLANFTERSQDPVRYPKDHDHGPLATLLVWLPTRAGLDAPAALAAGAAVIGAFTIPLVAVAVRSLAGEPAARELLPVLVLAPYAVFATGVDAVVMTLCAAMISAGVLATESGRGWRWRVGWAAAGGLLLGCAALFSYPVAWLGVSVVCVYFVRRQPLLNAVTGACTLVPLACAQLAGFVWTDGLNVAEQGSVDVFAPEPERPALTWAWMGLLVLVIACGPALVASARRLRRTPAWPYLVGAALGVGYALVSGLVREGGVERTWLPFFPWLLVAATAPERAGGEPSRTPLLVVLAGAVCAVLLRFVLRSG